MKLGKKCKISNNHSIQQIISKTPNNYQSFKHQPTLRKLFERVGENCGNLIINNEERTKKHAAWS